MCPVSESFIDVFVEYDSFCVYYLFFGTLFLRENLFAIAISINPTEKEFINEE